MLNLYFVRHGETEWNAENRLQGHLDSKLTDKGVRDTKLLANKLVEIPFEKIVTSPSGRALQTTDILISKRRASSFETDARLMEINLGRWQGKTTTEIEQFDTRNYHTYINNPEVYQAAQNGTSAERFQDVQDRLESFFRELEYTIDSGNVLIVTHGVVIKVLQMICKKQSIKHLWQPPIIKGTSLTVVQLSSGVRELVVEGDVSHTEM